MQNQQGDGGSSIYGPKVVDSTFKPNENNTYRAYRLVPVAAHPLRATVRWSAGTACSVRRGSGIRRKGNARSDRAVPSALQSVGGTALSTSD
jgi:hypothetical protein